MPELQLDLFADRGVEAEQDLSPSPCPAMVSADIEDEVLITAIAESDLADSCELAAEAGRRQLAAAVPALAALCRRFAGFGTRRLIPEQVAAIEALALIGGRDAADAAQPRVSARACRRLPCGSCCNTQSQSFEPMLVAAPVRCPS